jgi:glucosamine--fructose-6-phosphate aminotransferase (isomerizing)
MGSRTIAIGERGDAAAEAAADVFVPMPAGIPEALTPFVYKLPFEYLSCHIASKQNIAFLGFDNRKRQEVNFRQIFNSAQKAAAEATA